MPEYLTTTDVAKILGVVPQRLRTWKHRGQGPKASKVGTTVVYLREDVDAWIAERDNASADR